MNNLAITIVCGLGAVVALAVKLGWKLPVLTGKVAEQKSDDWAKMHLVEAIGQAKSDVIKAQQHLASLQQQAGEFAKELAEAAK